jgi:hypothetical protein
LWRDKLLLLVTNPHRRRGTQERPRNKGEDEMIAKTRNNNIRQTQANNSSPKSTRKTQAMPQKGLGKAHDFIFAILRKNILKIRIAFLSPISLSFGGKKFAKNE